MKKALKHIYSFLVFVIIVNTFIYPQSSGLEALKNNPQLDVKVSSEGVLEVKDRKTNTRYLKNISMYPAKDGPLIADLVIDLDTVNFANYDYLYRSWGSVPVENHSGKYISIDANKNGKNEIYSTYSIGFISRARIYEQLQDSLFSFIYEYPTDTLGDFFDYGDITGDGLLDIFVRGTQNSMHFFKQGHNSSLINTPNFIYNPFPPQFQPNTPILYDLDGDGILEMIYFLAAGTADSVWAVSNHVAKYNPQINNYELVYYHRPLPDFFTYGFSVGDFDEDGKGNFGTGSINGKFYIYEYVQGTQYTVEYEDTLETFNAFLSQFTDDMDGNGKPEVWIGGDFGSSVYGGVTRVYAFEAAGNGNYKQVYQIDILGLFSFFYGKIRYTDMDGDGIKDLVVTNDNLVFSFKSSGIGTYYLDFLYQIPPIDTLLEGIDFADLDSDGKSEIISEYRVSHNNSIEFLSLFYKRNVVTSVENEYETIPDKIELYPNYPNPFNPATTVRFFLPQETKVSLKIYDTLGKEIKTLIEGNLPVGEYESHWDGTNESGEKLPSGVYLITLKSQTFTKTVKALLIK